MKLWNIKAREDLGRQNNPWKPWFDKNFGFVVRAETEIDARKMADNAACDENSEIDSIRSPWLSPDYSTCVELTAEGEPGIIITDFAGA